MYEKISVPIALLLFLTLFGCGGGSGSGGSGKDTPQLTQKTVAITISTSSADSAITLGGINTSFKLPAGTTLPLADQVTGEISGSAIQGLNNFSVLGPKLNTTDRTVTIIGGNASGFSAGQPFVRLICTVENGVTLPANTASSLATDTFEVSEVLNGSDVSVSTGVVQPLFSVEFGY